MSELSLKSEPDWLGAARTLVHGLEAQPDMDSRVTVLEGVCLSLGDALYPGFAKLLAAVAHFGDDEVKRLTADTLARALLTARLPSARLPAWGADRFSGLSGFGGPVLQANTRRLGPVEFLCVWLVRDVANEPLSDEAFTRAMTYLLDLISASPAASRAYLEQIRSDVANPTEGLHNPQTRRLLERLAERWAAGDPPEAVAQAVVAAARADRAENRWMSLPR